MNLAGLVCKRDEKALFEPVSVEAEVGQCIELLGPNGAGKSTLLRTLAGIHTQYEGSFSCQDFLYQGHRVGLDELLTPLENMAWFAALEGISLSQDRMARVLARVDMSAFAFTPCGQMSQGQQRRIAMARWQISSGLVWLLDEPLTSLDGAGQTLLNELVAEHCEGGGIALCATHTPLTVSTRSQLQVHALGEIA